MDFFKSVFSDDPDPPSDPESPDQTTPGWSLGGLIQTISSRSESVLETYRRDLQEFTSGLKSETEVLKHVASSSLDIGAAKAQVSLESVGRAVDVVLKSTADIISHGKESLLAHDLDSEYSPSPTTSLSRDHSVGSFSGSNVRYSRFEAQLRALQCDVNTYLEDVEDDEFDKWKVGFDLGEYEAQVETLLAENGGVIEGIYRKVVPSAVDRETFWLRYFYRVHRLKQAQFVRAKLVKRAMKEEDEEEELSWDVDDDDDHDEGERQVGAKANEMANVSESHDVARDVADGRANVSESHVEALASDVANVVTLVEGKKEEGKVQVGGSEEGKGDVIKAASQGVLKEEAVKEYEETGEAKVEGETVKKGDEMAAEPSESGKDSDISVVSSQPSHDEEDLGWDEIEDIGSGDERTGTQLGSPDREELRKRLSTADDDEDLSWDIENDDEPVKH